MIDKIRVFEAFAGYGSQSIALRNIGVPHEVVAISEIDKYAIIAYEAIHGPTNNLGDISKIKIEDIPKHDLFTYSFPCQDISVAGRQRGMEKGKTRSGLLYECEKIIEHCRPKYLLMENVKNLVGKKFKAQFDEWLAYLETLGYTNYWEILDSKNYGVPQHRERVFCVSILGEHKPYTFPKKIKLDKCMVDILESEIEEKYYVNKPFKLVDRDRVRTKFANNILVDAYLTDIKFKQTSQVLNDKGICVTLDTMQGGYRQPKILCDGVNSYRVRKITPREAFRLMGMRDSDIDRIQETGLSNSQQYKMAGNSIVVDVLEGIFKELFQTND